MNPVPSMPFIYEVRTLKDKTTSIWRYRPIVYTSPAYEEFYRGDWYIDATGNGYVWDQDQIEDVKTYKGTTSLPTDVKQVLGLIPTRKLTKSLSLLDKAIGVSVLLLAALIIGIVCKIL